ncbi:hypothetical protein Bhyg_14335 [Pseudolycoriella hygida]|uniref:Uncharacterized protein n=1 Tax=Pseudolycoriella hygida TaxID=35572 RepID=A0A9Q0MRT2_9DIPT|nr:hypothetical protein Bhyg_14335 [Pseudolycoriella hygida]
MFMNPIAPKPKAAPPATNPMAGIIPELVATIPTFSCASSPLENPKFFEILCPASINGPITGLEIVPVLDLSKTIANTKEEYKRLQERIPDYKMRPIKVRSDEIKIKDKDWGFKTPKKEIKYLCRHNGERERPYVYLDPIPVEMRQVVIMELCAVPIDWKMLTILRPKSKVEEDYFSKIVEIGKLQLKTELKDKRDYALNPAIKKVKNKSGVVESRVLTCPECNEEYCNGRGCCDFSYDLYTRVVPKPPPKPKAPATSDASKTLNPIVIAG